MAAVACHKVPPGEADLSAVFHRKCTRRRYLGQHRPKQISPVAGFAAIFVLLVEAAVAVDAVHASGLHGTALALGDLAGVALDANRALDRRNVVGRIGVVKPIEF